MCPLIGHTASSAELEKRSVTLSLIVGTGSDSCDGKYLNCLIVFHFFQIPKHANFKYLNLPETMNGYILAHVQEQLKAAHIEQEKKKKRESAAREANKMKLQEHENKVRGALLDAFTKEDQERLQKNARKRLGGKE